MPEAVKMDKLVCPYSQCGSCYYVGTDIQPFRACPKCSTPLNNVINSWPQVQWLNAASDIQFLYDHRKLELLTIAVASYFEGVLHAFLYDGMLLRHPPTRATDASAFGHITDESERFVAQQKDNQRKIQDRETLLKRYRSWSGRLGHLCKEIFGDPFDSLLEKHYPKPANFKTNRDNIHKWRNLILHRGIDLERVWPKSTRDTAPDVAVLFVRECWEVFRVLYNEEIQKP